MEGPSNHYLMTSNECYYTPSHLTSKSESPGKSQSPAVSRKPKCGDKNKTFLFQVLATAGIALAITVAINVTILVVYSEISKAKVEQTVKEIVIRCFESSEGLNDMLTKLKCNVCAETTEIPEIYNEAEKTPPSFLESSCASILKRNPASHSGYYWIQSSNGSDIHVFCEMTKTCGGRTGGWMRVYKMDMKEPTSECPPELCLNSTTPRTCGACSNPGACSTIVLPVDVKYSRVCGKVIAYQFGNLAPFFKGSIVDGVQIFHGNQNIHIWSFLIATAEIYRSHLRACPCINSSDTRIRTIPQPIGQDYFCDTGAVTRLQTGDNRFLSDDPLWDGSGCEGVNMCCSFNNPPWFFKQLPSATNDSIYLRVCHSLARHVEDVKIESVDLYVQ